MIEKDNNIIPIEIKSAYNTKAKSLDLYIKNYQLKIIVVASLKELNLTTNKLFIPLYTLHYLNNILKHKLNK